MKCCPIQSTGNLDVVTLKTVYLDQGDQIQCCFANWHKTEKDYLILNSKNKGQWTTGPGSPRYCKGDSQRVTTSWKMHPAQQRMSPHHHHRKHVSFLHDNFVQLPWLRFQEQTIPVKSYPQSWDGPSGDKHPRLWLHAQRLFIAHHDRMHYYGIPEGRHVTE